MNIGDIISTSWDTGPYLIKEISVCNDPDCFVYHYVEVECAEHSHLVLLQSDHKSMAWVNGILPDLTTIHCDGEYITILPQSAFPPDPKSKHIPQLELFA